jgi:hypothetical protein
VLKTHAWAVKLVAENRAVMHTGSRVLAKAKRFYTGVGDDQYISTYDGKGVPAPVLLLETGDSFVARNEQEFLVLEDKELRYFAFAQERVADAIALSAKEGGVQQMGIAKVMLLIGIALRQGAKLSDDAPREMARMNAQKTAERS